MVQIILCIIKYHVLTLSGPVLLILNTELIFVKESGNVPTQKSELAILSVLILRCVLVWPTSQLSV